MATFREQIHIKAPTERVWRTLSDVGAIADWNPGLMSSHRTNEAKGIGATRKCIIDKKQWLDEEVIEFQPEYKITFRITRSTMPFKAADIRFSLEEVDGGSEVTVSPEYTLKFGILGVFLDFLFVRKVYTNGMVKLLEGLKRHVECQDQVCTEMRKLQ